MTPAVLLQTDLALNIQIFIQDDGPFATLRFLIPNQYYKLFFSFLEESRGSLDLQHCVFEMNFFHRGTENGNIYNSSGQLWTSF